MRSHGPRLAAGALTASQPLFASAAPVRQFRTIAGLDVRLVTAIVCATMFIAIPATCFVALERRDIRISRPIGLFLTCAAACGVAYVTYIVLFLFDRDEMRPAGIAALLLMLATLVTLLPLIPALVGVYDPERERLASIVDSTGDAIIGKDLDGTIISWNPGAEALYGYSREEAIGKHIRLIVPEDRYAELDEIMQTVQYGESIANLETERSSRSGRQLVISLSIAPLRDSAGRVIGASAIGRDITARRNMERQLVESNKSLDEFAYVASHDLKSPLRGIHNLCQFIEEDLGPDVAAPVTGHLAQMRGRVMRMEKLLDDLLEYSRVGRGEHQVKPVSVTEIVRSVTRLINIPTGFEVSIEGELPTLNTFVTPLEQVFRNLIQNAIKHHDLDKGLITISSRTVGSRIEFSVTDDGPGIEPQFRERIFRMFTTLAPRDKVEGSGIGLSLVAKLVRHHGGRVWLDGYACGRRGAVFKFTWPQSMPEEMV